MNNLPQLGSNFLSQLQPSGGLLSGLSPVARPLPVPVVSTPVYSGLEVDMVSLANACSILVTSWVDSKPTRVLIDGGCPDHADVILSKLASFRVTRLDHVV